MVIVIPENLNNFFSEVGKSLSTKIKPSLPLADILLNI